jgi:hypothetical protein
MHELVTTVPVVVLPVVVLLDVVLLVVVLETSTESTKPNGHVVHCDDPGTL